MPINAARLQAHFEAMSLIGKIGETGTCRPTMTSLEKEAFQLAAGWMQDAGMHVVAEISPRFLRKQSDKVISERATDAGLSVPALSVHYIKAPPRQGLLMGYAALSELEMDSAVTRLAKVIKSFS